MRKALTFSVLRGPIPATGLNALDPRLLKRKASRKRCSSRTAHHPFKGPAHLVRCQMLSGRRALRLAPLASMSTVRGVLHSRVQCSERTPHRLLVPDGTHQARKGLDLNRSYPHWPRLPP